MRSRFKGLLSNAVMVVLIFFGMTLFLSGHVGNGRIQDITVGLTGWLGVHQNLTTSTIEYFSIARLGIEICIAVAFTFVLAVAVGKLRSKSN